MRERMILLAVCLALTAAPALAQGLSDQLTQCLGISGAAERLACYDHIAHAVQPAAGFGAPRAAAQATPQQFGAETLPRSSPVVPARLDHVTADIAHYTTDATGRFTVTLSNGQVWQQMSGDTVAPHYHPEATQAVTISRGMLDSYDLRFTGRNASYKVKRIQ